MDAQIFSNLDAIAIQKFQQNRHPLLFIDHVEEAVPGVRAKGHKNFSYNEWFFPSHFEDEPTVPGFILVESLTQMFLMTFLTLPENKGRKTGFVSIEEAKFRRKIVPGERMDISSDLSSYNRGIAKGVSMGYIGGELACTLRLVVAVPDVLEKFRVSVSPK